jgi:hypothetical protein
MEKTANSSVGEKRAGSGQEEMEGNEFRDSFLAEEEWIRSKR